MYQNLIEDAKKEGIDTVVISALVKKNKKVLLIEDHHEERAFYQFPTVILKEGEIILHALERAITEITSMKLKKVVAYLGHYDLENEAKRKRCYHFVTEVEDPYALEETTHLAFAWLDVQEAVGYPITDHVREMIDQYARMQELS